MEASPDAKPILACILEDVAALLGLGEGQNTLELVFEDGHLRRWYAHTGARGRNVLAEYDEQAVRLVEHLAQRST